MAQSLGWSKAKRFELEDNEGRQEEFRQLLKSYMRFYSFVAQVVSLGDTGLEKLYSYAAWLIRLLPNREIPADIEITEDMMRLHAFKIEQKEAGSASLAAGDTMPLLPIKEFAAKPYTAEEEISLSEIIRAFNDRHGTQFTKEDFLRFERVDPRSWTRTWSRCCATIRLTWCSLPSARPSSKAQSACFSAMPR
jgi:type I restriction enzyme R subunit